MKAIVTVIGKDKPGIIAAVSSLLAKHAINIEDISQTVLRGNFTMVMLVSFENSNMDVAALAAVAAPLATEVGVEIHVQNEEIFDAIHKI